MEQRLKITLNIPDDQVKAIEHGAQEGVERWILNAIEGKANNGYKRMLREYADKLDVVPDDRSEFIRTVTTRRDYRKAGD